MLLNLFVCPFLFAMFTMHEFLMRSIRSCLRFFPQFSSQDIFSDVNRGKGSSCLTDLSFFGLKGTTKRNGALTFSHMTNALTDSFPTLELHYWERCRFADLFSTDVLGTYFFDNRPL